MANKDLLASLDLLASIRQSLNDCNVLISVLESRLDFCREAIEGALDFQAQPTTANKHKANKKTNSPSFLDAIKSRAAEDLNKIKAAIQEEKRQKKIVDNAEQRLTRRAALIRFFVIRQNAAAHITDICTALDKSYSNVANALSIYPEFQSDGTGYWNMKPDFYRAAWTKVGR